MGLDMYGCATPETLTKAVDFSVPPKNLHLHYWRKHPNLHGWMERLYREKGGQREDFNLSPVQLTEDDLERLESAIIEETLPHTDGCFFGASDGSELIGDLEFVEKARVAIFQGYAVFYLAWW